MKVHFLSVTFESTYIYTKNKRHCIATENFENIKYKTQSVCVEQLLALPSRENFSWYIQSKWPFHLQDL